MDFESWKNKLIPSEMKQVWSEIKTLLNVDQNNLLLAEEEAKKNNFTRAISILKKIKADSEVYQEAQSKIIQYRLTFHGFLLKESQIKAENACFLEALSFLLQIPSESELYSEAQNKIIEYKQSLKEQEIAKEKAIQDKIDEQASLLLEKSLSLGEQEKFYEGLKLLREISSKAQIYQQVNEKIADYQEAIKQQELEKEREKERIRKAKIDEQGNHLLEQALRSSEQNKFDEALTSLRKISSESSIYQEIQVKIAEYEEAFRHQQIAQAKAIQDQIDEQANLLLEKALNLAGQENFSQALNSLREILPEAQIYPQVKEKIAEYQEDLKQQKSEQEHEREQLLKIELETKASQLLESATKLVDQHSFSDALDILIAIPAQTQAYPKSRELANQIKSNRRVENGDRAIVVENFYTTHSLIPKNEFAQPISSKADGKLLVIEMQVENLGKETGNIIFSIFHVKDENGYKFDSISDTNLYIYEQENGFSSNSDSIRPTGSIKILKVFEINSNSQNITFQWKGKSINLGKPKHFHQSVTNSPVIESDNFKISRQEKMIHTTPASNNNGKFNSINERVEVGNRAITVENVYFTDCLESTDEFDDPIFPKTGGKFICVELTVENTGKETGNIIFSTFQVMDENGYKFDAVDESEIYLYASELGFDATFESIRPKSSAIILKVFEVNEDSNKLNLYWKGKSINLF